MTTNKLSATTIYYIRSAVWAFNSGLIFTSIWTLYYSVMHLSLTDVALIFVVITVSSLVLEVPTGIVADIYSRRLSVILGGIFIGLAYVLMGALPVFAIALIAGFIEAIGDTLISGALQAWITDEVGADNVGDVLLRGGQISTPAHWIGVAASIALAALTNYQAPIVLGGLMWFALTAFLIVFMPEMNFKSAAQHNAGASLLSHARQAAHTFADGFKLIRGSRVLTLLFIASFLRSAFADGFYKFSRAHVLMGFALPVIALPLLGPLKDNVWFGLLEALQGLFFLIGAEITRRTIKLGKTESAARALLAFHVAMIVAVVVFALSGSIVPALIAWVLIAGLQDLSNPIADSWLNRHIPSDVRATVLSMNSQTAMLGELGSSTALSVVGDRFGTRSALLLLNVLLLPLLLIFGRYGRDDATDHSSTSRST
jgi:DHA3 family tetracycline resistance protein-like MFS transporter